MRKSFAIIGAVLLSSVAAVAQETPKMEAFAGYQYVRFYPNSPFIPDFNGHGGSGQLVYNFNKWIGGVADIGGVNNQGLSDPFTGAGIDTTLVNFLFGPRVSWRRGRWHPFAELLVGVDWVTSSRRLFVFDPMTGAFFDTGARIGNSTTKFAFVAGGGVEFKVTKHFNFRPVQVQYYFTRFNLGPFGGEDHQNNIRAIAGFNFTFGEK
jgi:opacity protein-like surface antigen